MCGTDPWSSVESAFVSSAKRKSPIARTPDWLLSWFFETGTTTRSSLFQINGEFMLCFRRSTKPRHQQYFTFRRTVGIARYCLATLYALSLRLGRGQRIMHRLCDQACVSGSHGREIPQICIGNSGLFIARVVGAVVSGKAA